jgi:outer membrane protein assembly factor BamD (BamD/ComL family)
MYQSALRSAQSGDASRSLATLEGLMQKYPRSPLVQSARVEHFRVLLQMGNLTAAGREARRYLSEYPSGFARAEARQIALRGLGDAD